MVLPISNSLTSQSKHTHVMTLSAITISVAEMTTNDNQWQQPHGLRTDQLVLLTDILFNRLQYAKGTQIASLRYVIWSHSSESPVRKSMLMIILEYICGDILDQSAVHFGLDNSLSIDQRHIYNTGSFSLHPWQTCDMPNWTLLGWLVCRIFHRQHMSYLCLTDVIECF